MSAAEQGWRLDKMGGSKIFGNEGLVAACPRIVNARRIVRCVNAHDDLVAALEAMADHIEDAVGNCHLLKQARAALAKARGDGE